MFTEYEWITRYMNLKTAPAEYVFGFYYIQALAGMFDFDPYSYYVLSHAFRFYEVSAKDLECAEGRALNAMRAHMAKIKGEGWQEDENVKIGIKNVIRRLWEEGEWEGLREDEGGWGEEMML